MHAITIPRPGASSVLELREYPDPEPGPGELVIDVAAAGLNFAEISARQGLYPDAPKMPCVVGYEAAGKVAKLGEGTTGFELGQRVLVLSRFGAHATKVKAPAEQVFAIPDRMSFAEAAAIPVNYLTAHHMMFHIGNVHPNSTMLLHMAAGGVGTAVLQLLRTVEGVTVFGTASAGKHEYLRKLGCKRPIDYAKEDYAEVVRKETGGRGVDLVLDPLGGADWRKSWELLAPAGRMVAFGFSNAITGSTRNMFKVIAQALRIPFFTPMKAMNENKSLQGVNLGHLWTEIDVLRRQMERLVELYEEGVVKPHIHAEVPFAQAAEAHDLIEGRKNLGKVVLVP